MSLPNNALSTPALTAPILLPDRNTIVPLIDYELGGVALDDSSQGLLVQTWTATVSGNNIVVTPQNAPGTVIITRSNVETISLAFTQNMKVTLAYTQAGVVHLYYFDTLSSTYQDIVIAGAKWPRLSLDDKRASQSNTSDIILAYIIGNDLYYRQQRDRFTIERLLYVGAGGHPNPTLKNIGMNSVNRLQFDIQ